MRGAGSPPQLVLGPLLRYVGEREATVWVEVDRPCDVEVLGHRARTFTAEGHHYALVIVRGLDAGSTSPYEVLLGGHRVWPEPNSPFPPSVIRTLPRDELIRVSFGSCLITAPHVPPYTLDWSEDHRGLGIDAQRTLGLRLMETPHEEWPHLLLAMGDQVYADEAPEATRDFIRGRRDIEQPPYDGVADFEEYTHLYREAWQDPVTRWLLSTLPTAMIFDDHEVQDDWNISREWVEEIRREPWWDSRITSALMTYWIYQHIGNLSPDELEADEVWQAVTSGPDATQTLREFAYRADRRNETCRWSYSRTLGSNRLVVVDSRASRLFAPDRREMVDDIEWAWLEEVTRGEVDHLLVVTSLPFLLFPSVHELQVWSERVCAGAWGRTMARVGERLRRAIDLEHWGAFGESFDRMARLLRAVGAGERGGAPASIILLSGDVHYTSLARVRFRQQSRVRSRVYQIVCSPFRHPLRRRERFVHSMSAKRGARFIGRMLAAAAGAERPILRWNTVIKPSFDNDVGTLELRGAAARLLVERAVERDGSPRLETVVDRPLSGPGLVSRRRRRWTRRRPSPV